MTLIMTIIRPEGIWQSADNRLTFTTGRLDDNSAPKQLHIICPPLPGGPQLLLGFTGIAKMPDGTPMIQWIRETLRGESRLIMPMLEHLRQRLTRDLGGSKLWSYSLIFSGGIFEGEKRFYVEIDNLADISGKTKREFSLKITEVKGAMVFVAGSGLSYLMDRDKRLLIQQIRKRPARWEDHLGLLAAVNRRIAQRDPKKRVSPWCSASYISGDDPSGHTKRFSRPGEPAGPAGMEVVMVGIDLCEVSALMMRGRGALPGSQALEDAGKNSVTGRS